MRQIEDRFLWEQLSIFLSFIHIKKTKLRSPWGRDGSFFGVNSSAQECACVLMCVVGSESHLGLICSHRAAQAAGVPIHLWSEHTTSYPGKMLSTRVRLLQGSADIWATPGMSLFIKGQHLAIFISAIKHAALEGRERESVCVWEKSGEWWRRGTKLGWNFSTC